MEGRSVLPVFAAVFIVASITFACVIHTAMEDSPRADGEIVGITEFGNRQLDLCKDDLLKAGFSEFDRIDMIVGGKTYHNALITDTFAIPAMGEPFLYVGDEAGGVTIAIQCCDTGWKIGDKVCLKKTGHEDIKDRFPHLTSDPKTRSECASDAEYANFREVSLGSIASGRLYRSCTPILVSSDPHSIYADGLCRTAGIDFMLGLNMKMQDVDSLYAEGKLDGTHYKTVYESGRVLCDFVSVNLFTDKEYGTYLRTIAGNEGTFAISCSLGQDRTGFLIYLLEALMGASFQEAADDFMLSFYNNNGLIPGTEEYELTLKNRFEHMLVGIHFVDDNSHPESIDWDDDPRSYDLEQDAIQFMKTVYGMDDSEISLLRAHLSAPSI